LSHACDTVAFVRGVFLIAGGLGPSCDGIRREGAVQAPMLRIGSRDPRFWISCTVAVGNVARLDRSFSCTRPEDDPPGAGGKGGRSATQFDIDI